MHNKNNYTNKNNYNYYIFITIADKMSWSFRIQPNTFLVEATLSIWNHRSQFISHHVGPSLDILTWTATSGISTLQMDAQETKSTSHRSRDTE